MKSLKEQIGGDHYSKLAIQPAVYAQRNKLSYLQGNAIKYICRHKHKGKEEDIKKAIHYLNMILDRDYS